MSVFSNDVALRVAADGILCDNVTLRSTKSTSTLYMGVGMGCYTSQIDEYWAKASHEESNVSNTLKEELAWWLFSLSDGSVILLPANPFTPLTKSGKAGILSPKSPSRPPLPINSKRFTTVVVCGGGKSPVLGVGGHDGVSLPSHDRRVGKINTPLVCLCVCVCFFLKTDKRIKKAYKK